MNGQLKDYKKKVFTYLKEEALPIKSKRQMKRIKKSQKALQRSNNKPAIRAANYMALNQNANMWRPIMTILTTEAFGGYIKQALPAASAVELTHVATLIFDDMHDKSQTRRGKPSCHYRFDETTAQLAGLYLIARSNELTTHKTYTEHQKFLLTQKLAEASKWAVHGQDTDVGREHLKNEDDYLQMVDQKTGELMSTALYFGGVVMKAPQDALEQLNKIGFGWGRAYQMGDDIYDTAGVEYLGKPVGQDKEKKVELVRRVGINQMLEKREKEISCVMERLHDLGGRRNGFCKLENLIVYMRDKQIPKDFNKYSN